MWWNALLTTPAIESCDRAEFVGMEFALVSAQRLEYWIADRSADSKFAYVVTPNVDHVVRYDKASECIRAAYRNADVCVCDSRVLRKLASFLDVHLPVVTGSDLTFSLFHCVLRPGERVCLIGATKDTVSMLRQKFPALGILHHEPPMTLLTDGLARAKAIAFAKSAKGKVTFLAVGSPQQELLAHEMKVDGSVFGTALCIGASIDFLVGVQRRAPISVQRAGMEWAWRLMTQPRRLAYRYLVECPAIFPMVARWWWKNR